MFCQQEWKKALEALDSQYSLCNDLINLHRGPDSVCYISY